MSRPKVKLTAELRERIAGDVEKGAYPNVAAIANGVPEWQWKLWLKQSKREPYKALALRIDQAKAIARMQAEIRAAQDDPNFWLRNGPGREMPDTPGWSAMTRAQPPKAGTTINLFASPEFMIFLATLRQILAPHPEALAKLGQALQKAPMEIINNVP